ncbi:flavin-containing monooxygenase [Amycolatopsis jejuensis]|uniref:flavin-containing monooxygenase n=1 Tax=Amycolatopsis jejuensis TaxID=330084 RepID=UPI0005257762|nr:NAD(P)/FAD-dependent oxidoreductase [Amycolatopsis jejuensis]
MNLTNPDAVHDVVIIGAGPGGICAAIMLEQRGVRDVVVLERSAGIGGTWYNNRYPGLACDVPSDLYSYSFFQDYDWSRAFARRSEMCRYVEEAAQRFGVADRVVLNAGVESARWDEAAAQWVVVSAAGTYRARTVIGAVGMFNEPSRPEIPGLDSFGGPLVHTAEWPGDADVSFLEGKSVGVIGAAASAVQLVPAIAPVVGELSVFHRTPQWVFPKDDQVYDDAVRAERRADPSIVAGLRVASTDFVDRLCDFGNATLMAELREKGLGNLDAVSDPRMREKLTPVLPIGAQRTLLSSEYYPAFNQDHVRLVTDPIAEVRPDEVVTSAGAHRVDVLLLATGYAAHRFLSVIDVAGRDGTDLASVWEDGAYAYKGITLDRFPNLFMLYGPNTNGGSIIDKLESQSRYAVGKICHLLEHDLAALEVSSDAVTAYNKQLAIDLERVEAWRVEGSRYFRAPSGRVVTQCPYPPTEYDALTLADDLADYVTTAR